MYCWNGTVYCGPLRSYGGTMGLEYGSTIDIWRKRTHAICTMQCAGFQQVEKKIQKKKSEALDPTGFEVSSERCKDQPAQ